MAREAQGKTESSKMRFMARSLLGLFLLALTVALLGVAGFVVKNVMDERRAEKARPRVAQERVIAANVIALEFDRITPVLTAYGEVQSTRRLELRATTGGTIAELAPNFEDGARVSKGALLLRLDPAEATAAHESAKANLSDARATLAEATRALEIARDDLTAAQKQAVLRDQAFARQQEIDARGLGRATDTETAELAASAAAQAVLNRRSAVSQAEARLDQSQTAVIRSEIALSEAARKLADTEIRAEFDGLLSGVSAVQGGLLASNEKLGELIDPTALEVAFRVSTAQFGRLLDENGDLVPAPVDVVLDVMGAELAAKARLIRVGAAVETGQTGRLLYAAIETGAAGFRAGDFVTVRLAEPALDAVALVPAAAVDAKGTVLVLGDDDRLTEAPVEVLRRQGDAIIIRASALNQGQEIVAERTPLLGSGLKVRPMRAGAGAAVPAAPATIALDPERRARLIAFVEGNANMPAEAKARIMSQLEQAEVPTQVVERLEQRMGG